MTRLIIFTAAEDMAANHQRNSSHPKKLPAHARPSKPAPLTKRHSYQSAYKTAHKPVLAIAKHDGEEELMAASFLNYWYCPL